MSLATKYVDGEEEWHKAYRYHERYFIYAHKCRRHPLEHEDLQRLMSELPVSSSDYDAWFRKKCDELDEAETGFRERRENNTSPVHKVTKWIKLDILPCSDVQSDETWFAGFDCEIDLDNSVFMLKGFPLFSLRHIPPPQLRRLFVDPVDHSPPWRDAGNTYGHRLSPPVVIPEEYRFDPLRDMPPPLVDDSALLSYKKLQKLDPASSDVSLDTILGLPMACDEISIRFREICIGAHVQRFGQSIMTSIGLARDYNHFTKWSKALALTLAATVLLPIHLIPAELTRVPNKSYENKRPYCWLREHICLYLATHLHVERNRKAAICELVDEIARDPSNRSTVFGVAFSVFHCVIVKVDKSEGLSYVHTDVLQFLPDFYATSPSTVGISALVRLGNRPAVDDIRVFHALLKRLFRSWDKPPRKKSNQRSEPLFSLLRLPVELIGVIAGSLDVVSLNSLAIVCTRTMEACLPLLRVPQLLADHFPIGAKWCLMLTAPSAKYALSSSAERYWRAPHSAKLELFSGSFCGRSVSQDEVHVNIALEDFVVNHGQLKSSIRLPGFGPTDFIKRTPELEYSQGTLEDSDEEW